MIVSNVNKQAYIQGIDDDFLVATFISLAAGIPVLFLRVRRKNKISKNNKNLKIKEIPFVFKNRYLGETKSELLSFILSYISTMIKLKMSK